MAHASHDMTLALRRPKPGGCLSNRALQRGLALLGLLLVLTTGAKAASTSVSAILTNPDQYDKQAVTLDGTVTTFSKRVSQRGNPYYTFDLSDGRRALRVFSFSDSSCRDGMTASVDGTFEKVKRQGRYVFYNEVTTTKVTCR